jgi:dihydrofolate reductase
MRRLTAFTQITLNGYFSDVNGDLSWAHRSDPEFQAFVADNARGGGVLLMGRVTYEMMASYWPTPHAAANEPEVAERMNALPKVVFSRTLDEPSWQNTKLVKGELVAAVRKMKEERGPDIAILGSASLIAQLAPAGLVDEYQLVINPIALPKGRTIFEGMKKELSLKLAKTRVFKNGNVLLCYQPT